MKATISEFETEDGPLWEGEALSFNWDGANGEFVILGEADDEGVSAVVNSIAEKQKLTIGIEDSGSTQLVWRGYVGSAQFQAHGPEHMKCSLIMALDDWYGIAPRFSTS
ncbi:MAG: hypothetical protein JSW38_09410 [Dehalococcoidia bacterium]|nr:MAG: hypothetical protein JSW38_09410 [Dehalococcoidia bacterium]